MKPETDNHEDDAFERGLSGFHRDKPPGKWREDLIANAIPPSRSPAEKTRRFSFTLPQKLFGGGLAAAWLVILGLWLVTPADSRVATAAPSVRSVKMAGSVRLEPFSMITWRIASGDADEDWLP